MGALLVIVVACLVLLLAYTMERAGKYLKLYHNAASAQQEHYELCKALENIGIKAHKLDGKYFFSQELKMPKDQVN